MKEENQDKKIDSLIKDRKLSQHTLLLEVNKARKFEKKPMISYCFKLLYVIVLVPDHDGGRPKEINAWFLYTHMVYL